MKKILLLSLLYSISFSQTIETLIQNAYDKNYELKAMQKEVEINEQSTKVSDNWDNPIFSAGLTDLQLDDISNRTLEPMQTQFITLSQKIPLRNKKGISKEISEHSTILSKLKIENHKAKIASQIAILAYKSAIIDKYLNLLNTKSKNFKKIKELALAYQRDADKSLDLDIKLLKLENNKETLLFQKEEIIQKIQKLTVLPVTNIDVNLEFTKLPKIDLDIHPMITFFEQQLKIQNSKVKLSTAKKIPDLKVSTGYFQRDNRDDYFNLSFAMPLPIGDSEEIEIVKSKLAVLKTKEQLNALKNNFKNEVELLQKKAQMSKKNYTRYNQKLLPKQKKVTTLLKTKNRIGKANLTQVIKSANSSLSLEELALKELGNYFEATGALRYYQ